MGRHNNLITDHCCLKQFYSQILRHTITPLHQSKLCCQAVVNAVPVLLPLLLRLGGSQLLHQQPLSPIVL